MASAFSQSLESAHLKPEAVFWASQRVEAASGEKAEGAPKKTGRGLSRKQLQAAVAGQPLTRKARAKAQRAIAALLAKKGGAQAPSLTDLFSDAKVLVRESVKKTDKKA